MTGSILLLAFLAYIVAIDKNVGDYLYLKLIRTPILLVQIKTYQIRLYVQIRWSMFLMRRNIVPRKYFVMAKDITRGKNML
jgi:hypothetical protein